MEKSACRVFGVYVKVKLDNVRREQNLIRHNPNLACLHNPVKPNFSGTSTPSGKCSYVYSFIMVDIQYNCRYLCVLGGYPLAFSDKTSMLTYLDSYSFFNFTR